MYDDLPDVPDLFFVSFENDDPDIGFFLQFFGETADATLDGISFMVDAEKLMASF